MSVLLCLLLSQGHAADLVVRLDRPVFVLVDGHVWSPDATGRRLRVKDLAEGTHEVHIKNLVGTVVTGLELDVGSNEEVTLSYARRQLVEVGRRDLAPPPPMGEEQVPVEEAPQAPVEARPESSASFGFRGMLPDMLTFEVDGETLPWSDPHDGFLAAHLEPGNHHLRMAINDELAFESDVVTHLGRHRTCTVVMRFDHWAMECDQVDGTARPERGDDRRPTGPKVASSDEVDGLRRAVEEASFSSDQLDVLRTAAAHQRFTCAQVARLLEPISFDGDKVEAVKVLRDAIVDPQHAYALDGSFSFSTDQETVRALFR